ncbi:MarR family transcriptional regulator [Brevibacterium sp. LS14]|uniref:HTH marR-type domain-containing protein n=1 Tax=Brevibacterium casei S18 TaxID=1229781 RepID=K9AVV2_9MICO|nr:hypothetical protein C272_13808 [Brevibacterium casei S18]NJE66495.1 MarR family transcriptional regulator [Brevibacterium sp. LS14]
MSAPAAHPLFAFVRRFSRMPITGEDAVAENGRLVLVAEAVDALARQDIEPTVNAVAAEIGIDQSGASRLITAAADAGLVATAASAHDARRRTVHLTPTGQRLLVDARQWQGEVADRLTAGWSRKRREEFFAALSEVVATADALDL